MRTSDGDGTVPVISTGLMCYKGWRGTKLNPSNIPIVSREYRHQPTNAFKDLRYYVCFTLTWCCEVFCAEFHSSSTDNDALCNYYPVTTTLTMAANITSQLCVKLTQALVGEPCHA